MCDDVMWDRRLNVHSFFKRLTIITLLWRPKFCGLPLLYRFHKRTSPLYKIGRLVHEYLLQLVYASGCLYGILEMKMTGVALHLTPLMKFPAISMM